MRARKLTSVVTLIAGAALTAACFSIGCGSKTDETGTPAPEDTGVADTNMTPMDTSMPIDSAPPKMDSTSMEPDVPGSLFDANIPDVVFEGGKTAKGCYDCTITSCKTEVEACDKDAKCRGVLLCVLTTCSSFSDVACAFGCATDFGVGLGDPIVGTLQDIGTCNQTNCKEACPALPVDAGGKTDAKSDVSSSETSSGETGASDSATDAPPSSFGPKLPKSKADRDLADLLLRVRAALDETPEARDGLIEHLQH